MNMPNLEPTEAGLLLRALRRERQPPFDKLDTLPAFRRAHPLHEAVCHIDMSR
jgi:hypothetical protein